MQSLMKVDVARAATATALAISLSSAMAAELGIPGPLSRAAVMVNNPTQSAQIAVTSVGQRIVAVGERGVIVYSDDNGTSWKQASVPVSVTLTAVRFVDEKVGWATGHAGVLLQTADGGITWKRKLDGNAINSLLVKQIGSGDEKKGEGEATIKLKGVVKQLVSDGADKPLLDVHFMDRNRGIVVGAYGLALITADAGETWKPILDRLDNPRGLHLNAVCGQGNTLIIVGEQGTVLLSKDRGETFDRIETGYRGSFFAVSALDDKVIYVGGLKGNAFGTADLGATWQAITLGTQSSIAAIQKTARKTILVADQGGQIFESSNPASGFARRNLSNGMPLSSFAELPNGDIVTAGLRGITKIRYTAESAKTKSTTGTTQ